MIFFDLNKDIFINKKQYLKTVLSTLLFLFFFTNKCMAQIPSASLNCVTTLSSGDIELNWIPAMATCGAFISQDIYYSTSYTGPYTLLVSLTTPSTSSYTHIGANGNITTYYYYIVNNYACGSVAAVSDTLDNAYPTTPVINYVSVNSSNQASLYWQESSSPETYGYIIYYLSGVTAIPIDTVYGATNYTGIASDANTTEHEYTVAAIDSCLTTGLFSTLPHHNIVLTKSNNQCNTDIELSWNAYENWSSGIGNYILHVSTNGGVYMNINLGPAALTTVYSAASDGDQVCFYIEARSGDGLYSSNSNTLCIDISAVQAPSYLYLQSLSVTENNMVEAIWNIDANADLLALNIAAGSDSNSMSTLSTPLLYPLPATDTFLITNQSPSSYPVYAQVSAIDSCNTTKEGSMGKTIYLKGRANENYSIDLNWTFFELDYATVTSYQLYRIDAGARNLLATFSSNEFYYTDISAYNANNDTVLYEVDATYTANFPDGTSPTLSSTSNRAAFTFLTKILAPNAFTPEGDNPIFRPYVLSADKTDYVFNIADKWGTIVFETNDINAGWDGTFNGEKLAMDVYPWYVKVKGLDGKFYQQKGSVLLLR